MIKGRKSIGIKAESVSYLILLGLFETAEVKHPHIMSILNVNAFKISAQAREHLFTLVHRR